MSEFLSGMLVGAALMSLTVVAAAAAERARVRSEIHRRSKMPERSDDHADQRQSPNHAKLRLTPWPDRDDDGEKTKNTLTMWD